MEEKKGSILKGGRENKMKNNKTWNAKQQKQRKARKGIRKHIHKIATKK
jgi:hypothetical protein